VAAPDEIAGLGHRTGRPRPNTAIDWANQKLTPTEGFVLSRVDGRMSYDEICMVSGLSRDETCGSCATSNKLRLILGRGRWRWVHRAPVPPCLHVHKRRQGPQLQARGRRTRRGARRPNLRPRGQGRGTVGLRLAARTPRRRVARGPWRSGGMAGCTFGTEGAHRPAAPPAPAAFGVGPAGRGEGCRRRNRQNAHSAQPRRSCTQTATLARTFGSLGQAGRDFLPA